MIYGQKFLSTHSFRFTSVYYSGRTPVYQYGWQRYEINIIHDDTPDIQYPIYYELRRVYALDTQPDLIQCTVIITSNLFNVCLLNLYNIFQTLPNSFTLVD